MEAVIAFKNRGPQSLTHVLTTERLLLNQGLRRE